MAHEGNPNKILLDEIDRLEAKANEARRAIHRDLVKLNALREKAHAIEQRILRTQTQHLDKCNQMICDIRLVIRDIEGR